MTPAVVWPRTSVARLLDIRYPIIQGPFGGFASQRLTATVSNAGGLGSLGGFMLDPAGLRRVVAEIRAMTERPFAVKLWVSREDSGAFTTDAEAFARSLAPLAVQRTISRAISTAAEKAGRPDLMSMWAGQSTNLSHFTDAAALIEALAFDAAGAADAVLAWRASTRLRTATRERYNHTI